MNGIELQLIVAFIGAAAVLGGAVLSPVIARILRERKPAMPVGRIMETPPAGGCGTRGTPSLFEKVFHPNTGFFGRDGLLRALRDALLTAGLNTTLSPHAIVAAAQAPGGRLRISCEPREDTR